MQARPDRTRRIVLLRNTFDNLGDVAMMEAEITAIRQRIPEAQLTVLTDDFRLAGRFPDVEWGESDVVLMGPSPRGRRKAVRRALLAAPVWINKAAGVGLAWAASMYRRRAIARFAAAADHAAGGESRPPLRRREGRLLDTLRRADLVIGGGGLIGRIPAMSEPRRAIYRALRAMRVPYVLHGLSVSDDQTDESYSGAALVVVRDRGLSMARALASGVSPERLMSVIDPAFTVTLPGESGALARLHSLRLERDRFIALNVRQGESTSHASRQWLDELAAVATETALRSSVHDILLFGLQSYRDNDDALWLSAIERRLRAPLRVTWWPMDGETAELRGALAQARLVISCRYHGALFALSGGVPTLGIIPRSDYEAKMKGLFGWYDLDRLCVKAGESFPEVVLNELALHDAELRLHIGARNQELSLEGHQSYERIRGLLALDR